VKGRCPRPLDDGDAVSWQCRRPTGRARRLHALGPLVHAPKWGIFACWPNHLPRHLPNPKPEDLNCIRAPKDFPHPTEPVPPYRTFPGSKNLSAAHRTSRRLQGLSLPTGPDLPPTHTSAKPIPRVRHLRLHICELTIRHKTPEPLCASPRASVTRTPPHSTEVSTSPRSAPLGTTEPELPFASPVCLRHRIRLPATPLPR
jgi:hypothetical protein